MKRSAIWQISLTAAFALAAPAALAAAAQAQPAAGASPSQSAQDQHGTGVVPPGVKLDSQMPGAAPPNPFEFPKAATKTLTNGLRVFVVTDHHDPAVAVRLVILTAGSVKDPSGMPGVAQMAASLLTQGTEKRSARDIAEAIDFVGGSLGASAGKDSTTVTLDVVKKDVDTGLDLMSDVVLHPAFRAEELDRQRQQLLSSLALQYSDPEYLASVVFSRVVYGSSPYGWPQEGTPETAKKLQRDQIAKFHDANYAPNQALLAFAGDITPEAAFAAAEKYFGGWAKLDVPDAIPAEPPAVQGQHIWLVDKPDAVQTQIRAGKIAIPLGDPNYIPVAVTNRIFGGGYNSRLNTEVRVKKGLTYGAFSTLNAHRYSGSFTVGTFTRTEATVQATRLVIDLVAKMASGDVTSKEMDVARDYLAGVYPIQTETAEQVADRVLTVAAFNLPADYNRTYPERIRAVTAAQVKEMAQRYLATNNLDIVLVGDIGAFREALKKEFPAAQYTEIPFDQVDVLSAELRKPHQASAETTPESLAQGKETLLAAAKAAGGDALSSVTGLSMTETGKFFGYQNGADLTVKWIVSYPDRSHGEVTLGPNKITQVCDGKSAWIQFGDQTRDATATLGEFERGISLFGGGWGVYRRALAGNLPAQAIGEETIDGKKTVGIAVSGPFGQVKLYFDPETHLLAAARYQSAGPHGASDTEQHWSDYRTVEGRQFAFSTVIYRDGAKFAETSIQDLKLNPQVDDAFFLKTVPAVPASK
jgi:zinc protease